MSHRLCFFLLFTYLLATQGVGEEDGCVSQPSKTLYSNIGQSVVIPCTVNSRCLNLVYKWFVFKENNHFEVDKKQSKYSLHGASLRIELLNMTDSGVYHCAATSSQEELESATPYIALGTTLVVRDTFRITVQHIELWILSIFLAIYGLAILSFIIIKKYGCPQVCRKTISAETKTSTKRSQFHDVLQELYKRRNLETNKQTGRTKRPHNETARTEPCSSHDDIYQNV